MSDNSKIEWTDRTWNPTTGCDRVSPGCDHCYALTLAKRLKAMGSAKYQTDGDQRTSGPGFGVASHPEALSDPFRWSKPQRVFVNSMSDLFHPRVDDDFIVQVWAVMTLASQHTFQVLTKRPARMYALLSHEWFRQAVAKAAWAMAEAAPGPPYVPEHLVVTCGRPWYPLDNVWVGVSVENAAHARRIGYLRQTPATVRFVSAEPLLGPLDGLDLDGIHWVIAGGESGHGARPMHPDWARSLRDQCRAAGVPFLFKQHGEWLPLGPLYDQHDDDGEADDARMDAVTAEVMDGHRVVQLERDGATPDGYQPGDPRTWLMARVGKKAAGRQLDGRLWAEYPAGATPVVATTKAGA
jgi:protein gp37